MGRRRESEVSSHSFLRPLAKGLHQRPLSQIRCSISSLDPAGLAGCNPFCSVMKHIRLRFFEVSLFPVYSRVVILSIHEIT